MTLEEKIVRLMRGTAALYAPSPELLERLMDALVKQGYDVGQTDEDERDTAWNNGNFCVRFMKDARQSTPGIRLSTMEFCRGLGLGIVEITEDDFSDAPVSVTITTVNHAVQTIIAKVKRQGNSYVISEIAHPKFSVGDWYVDIPGRLGKIIGLHDGHYEYKYYTKGTIENCECEPFDNYCTKVEWNK